MADNAWHATARNKAVAAVSGLVIVAFTDLLAYPEWMYIHAAVIDRVALITYRCVVSTVKTRKAERAIYARLCVTHASK